VGGERRAEYEVALASSPLSSWLHVDLPRGTISIPAQTVSTASAASTPSNTTASTTLGQSAPPVCCSGGIHPPA